MRDAPKLFLKVTAIRHCPRRLSLDSSFDLGIHVARLDQLARSTRSCFCQALSLAVRP